MALAGSSGPTAAAFRCLLALPVLLVLAGYEFLDGRSLSGRQVLRAVAGGALLAADLILWFAGIIALGAGLATVIQDTQVVFVALGAQFITRERPPRRLLALVPVLLLGVALIAGSAGSGRSAHQPLGGAVLALASAIAYAGLILVLGRPLDARTRSADASFLFVLTLAGAAFSIVVGAGAGDLQLDPRWPVLGWLFFLAMNSQVIGWLLLTVALRRVTSLRGSMLLLIQPAAAVIYAWGILHQLPSPPQLVGVAIILATSGWMVMASARTPEDQESDHVGAK